MARKSRNLALVGLAATALALSACSGSSQQAVAPAATDTQVVMQGTSWSLTLCDPGAAVGTCPTSNTGSYSGTYTIPFTQALPAFEATSNPAQFDLIQRDIGCSSFLNGWFAIDPVIGMGLDWPYLAGDTSSDQSIELDATATLELWAIYPPADCVPAATTARELTAEQKRKLRQFADAQPVRDVPSEQECKASSYCGEVNVSFPIATAGANGPSPVDSHFTSQIVTVQKTGNSTVDYALSLPRQVYMEVDATLTAS